MDADEVKRSLASNAENVCRLLFPNGRRKANEWHIGSLDGEAGSSMRIHLEGNKAGIWADFSSDHRGSNLLELWRATKQVTFKEALDQAREYLGVAHHNHQIKPAFQAPKPKEKVRLPNEVVGVEGSQLNAKGTCMKREL